MVVKWRLVLHRAVMFVYINQVVQVSRRISYQMTRIYKTQLKKSKQKQSILSFSLWRSKPLNPTQISNNPNLQKLSKTQCSLLLLNLLEIIKWRCYFMRGRKKRWCGLNFDHFNFHIGRERENVVYRELVSRGDIMCDLFFIFIFFINVNIRIKLHAPRLILWTLKLTTM
jgi:hypothetical protein